jgi:hypothetical protein
MSDFSLKAFTDALIKVPGEKQVRTDGLIEGGLYEHEQW